MFHYAISLRPTSLPVTSRHAPASFRQLILSYFATLVSENGEITFSEVKAFIEKQPHVTAIYKSISTSSNQTITLSPNHLIYARKVETEKYLPMSVENH